MSEKLLKDKNPLESRGFFLSILFFDFLILFFSFLRIFLLIEFIVFHGTYFFYLKGKLKKVFSILLISFVIFLFNLFQPHDGILLFSKWGIVLTDESLLMAMKKSLLLFCLFLISSNCIYQNRNFFISQNRLSLFSLSVQKFFYFFERINFSNGKLLKNIYLCFYKTLFYSSSVTSGKAQSLKSFYLFHIFFFIFMLCSIFCILLSEILLTFLTL